MGYSELRGMEMIAEAIHDLAAAMRGLPRPGSEEIEEKIKLHAGHTCKDCALYKNCRQLGDVPCTMFRLQKKKE